MTGSSAISKTVPRVRVVCDEPGAYHDARGISTLGTYGRVGEDAYWTEWRGKSARTERKYQAWLDSLTEAEKDAIIHAEKADPSWPFAGAMNPGQRPATATYVRGDAPPGDDFDQRKIEEAITRGVRPGVRRGPADAADLAGHGKIVLSCGCGLRRRALASDVWAVFDVMVANRLYKLTLRQLMTRLDARSVGAPE